MRKVFFYLIGVTLTLIGLPLFLAPMPFGFVILLPGIAFLIMANTRFAAWVRCQRARHSSMDGPLRRATACLPRLVGGALDRTDPKISKPEKLPEEQPARTC